MENLEIQLFLENSISKLFDTLSIFLVTKPFHEAIGCSLHAVRVTLEETLDSIGLEKKELTLDDIELNQVAARRKIMDSGEADWRPFIKLHS